MASKKKNPKKSKRPPSFKPGDTLVFEPKNFNPEYWAGLSEEDRVKYYGALGYGAARPHLFTFICEHNPQRGHCVLVSMQDQHVETMRHPTDFRLATEDET
jgi:hypothetical protein